jgi:hypothetical protein
MTASAPVPALEQWESRMQTFGRARCEYLAVPRTFDDLLNATYYDAERIFYQIAAYTGNPEWAACAKRAGTVYRDRYVVPNRGVVPGYANFTHGLTMDYLRSGDAQSQNAVILLSQHAAYASDYAPLNWTVSADLSREVAYAVISYINAEKVGASPRARLPLLVTQALGHIDQWFISKTYRCGQSGQITCDPGTGGQYYIQPFMVGLTSAALIMYYDKTGDARVLPAVRTAMDWLWANAWVAADESFWYANWVPNPAIPFPAQPGAPDLNLLIAPAYAWLFHQTGDTRYRDEGDAVFAGGVKFAYLGAGKQFDQNYWWSFDYVKWRTMTPRGAGTASAPLVRTTSPGGGVYSKTTPPPNAPSAATPPPSNATSPGANAPVPPVSITAPASGSVVTGSVTLAANVSANSGGTIVQFTVDGNSVGSKLSSSPYSVRWDTRTAPNGIHLLAAVAQDVLGNVTVSVPIFVTVNNAARPLVISIVADRASVSSATITWTTDKSSTSQVEYGLTTAYGRVTRLEGPLVTVHSQKLSGLTAGTVYHYRVKSKDAAGHSVTSADFTLTTAPE